MMIQVYDRVRIGKGKVHWRVHRIFEWGGSGNWAEVTTLLGKRAQVVRMDRLTKVEDY